MTVQSDSETRTDQAERRGRWVDGATLLSIGGVLGGLTAASCCVVPFALFLGGISGAWIGQLTALEPYRPYFAVFAIGCIGGGFRWVYRRPAVACADDSYCAKPVSRRAAKIGLW